MTASTTTYQPGDTSEIRAEVADLVLQYGSLRAASDHIPHMSAGYLSRVMRCQVAPPPCLLDFLGFDRIYYVRYVRK